MSNAIPDSSAVLVAVRSARRLVATVFFVTMCIGTFRSQAAAQSITRIDGFAPSETVFVSRVSANGEMVVGSSGSRGFRWTRAGGLRDLGAIPGGTYSRAYGVSADGSVIVGMCGPSAPFNWEVAFRWTEAGGMIPLGGLPAGNRSSAIGVSADGSTVVGSNGEYLRVVRSFRWTAAGGMVDLGTVPGLSVGLATGVNADGSVVVGSCGVIDWPTIAPFRWSASTGMQQLPMPEWAETGVANVISSNGSTIVGYVYGHAVKHAVRWTGNGLDDIGAAVPERYSEAMGASGDGSVVVGEMDGEARVVAFMWTAELGMVDLNVYLPSQGVDLTGWSLELARDISSDGRTIIGRGMQGARRNVAWVVQLPPVCFADFDESGAVDSQDLFAFLDAFFVQDPGADFQRDGFVNSQDFFDFVGAFFAGC